MTRILGAVIGVVLCFSFGPIARAATLYVKVGGSGDCTTNWAGACTLPQAITNANAGDQIWVQAGTYSPFALKNAVKIIGGFAGTESSASQSDPAANETIVDGGGTEQCVITANDAASTMLRGFTITGGRDDGDDGGGGVLVQDSSALFVQCVFRNNVAVKFGAAIGVRGTSTPQFINCSFYDNGSGSGTSVTPLGGGAVYTYSGSPTFVNCLFRNNKAGEGAVLLSISGAPTFINCTMANNEATFGYGGSLFDPKGSAVIKNCILWDNSYVHGEHQIFIRRGVSTTVTNSDVQKYWNGTGNIGGNPLFSNPGTNDYTIPDTSPCFNAGSNTALPSDVADIDWDLNTAEDIPYDLAGNDRTSCTNVDMGAYEYQDTGPVRACCYNVASCADVTQCECDVLNGTWNPLKPCFRVNCGGPLE